MRPRWTLAAALSVACCANLAAAADAPRTLEDRVQELERRVGAGARPPAASTTAKPPGFGYRSPEGDLDVGLSGYVQADARHFAGDRGQGTDTFLARRVRLSLQAVVDGQWSVVVNPDFGLGAAVLQDAYVSFDRWPAARLRAGKKKVPFGLERLQRAPNDGFVELSLASDLTPNRDIGVEAAGETPDRVLGYALGLYNGGPDGSVNDADSNNAKDVAARVFAQPFSARGPDALKGLGAGLGFTSGAQDGALPTYKTTGQQTFFSYASGAVAAGRRRRWSPQAYYSLGPFGFLGEFVRSSQEVRKGAVIAYCKSQAWQASASWLVTGEDATYAEVKPAAPLDPARRQWGAWELRARLSRLDADPQAFDAGLASGAASARAAVAWAAGVNWYASRRVKAMLDFERTTFQGGSPSGNRVPEDAAVARLQALF